MPTALPIHWAACAAMSRLTHSIIDQRLVAAVCLLSPSAVALEASMATSRVVMNRSPMTNSSLSRRLVLRLGQLAGVHFIADDRCLLVVVTNEVRQITREDNRLILRVIVGQKDDVNFGKLQAFSENEAECQRH